MGQPSRLRLAGSSGLRALGAAAFLAAPCAAARTLTVGEGEAYARPSDAARVAEPGDTVRILPGTYYDCSVWSADGLVIEGSGPTTVLTDTTCQGKAIFVVAGRDVAVRDLVLARARAVDGNGAGIRAEGANLHVQRVRFEDNQDGVLAGDQPDGMLRIEDCVFVDNGGAGSEQATAALVVGDWARLVVRDTRFEQGRGAAAILSRAALTEVSASRFDAPEAGRGATVQATGGLVIENSSLQPWPGSEGRSVAVLALPGERDGPLVLRRNVLEGKGTLLLNWSGRDAEFEQNQVGPDSVAHSDAGAWMHRLRSGAREAYGAANATTATLKRRIAGWLGRE